MLILQLLIGFLAALTARGELDAWSDALYVISNRGWPLCFHACMEGAEAPNDMWSCGRYRNFGGCLCQAYEFLHHAHDCVFHHAECPPAVLNATADKLRERCRFHGVELLFEEHKHLAVKTLRDDAVMPVSRVSFSSGFKQYHFADFEEEAAGGGHGGPDTESHEGDGEGYGDPGDSHGSDEGADDSHGSDGSASEAKPTEHAMPDPAPVLDSPDNHGGHRRALRAHLRPRVRGW